MVDRLSSTAVLATVMLVSLHLPGVASQSALTTDVSAWWYSIKTGLPDLSVLLPPSVAIPTLPGVETASLAGRAAWAVIPLFWALGTLMFSVYWTLAYCVFRKHREGTQPFSPRGLVMIMAILSVLATPTVFSGILGIDSATSATMGFSDFDTEARNGADATAAWVLAVNGTLANFTDVIVAESLQQIQDYVDDGLVGLVRTSNVAVDGFAGLIIDLQDVAEAVAGLSSPHFNWTAPSAEILATASVDGNATLANLANFTQTFSDSVNATRNSTAVMLAVAGEQFGGAATQLAAVLSAVANLGDMVFGNAIMVSDMTLPYDGFRQGVQYGLAGITLLSAALLVVGATLRLGPAYTLSHYTGCLALLALTIGLAIALPLGIAGSALCDNQATIINATDTSGFLTTTLEKCSDGGSLFDTLATLNMTGATDLSDLADGMGGVQVNFTESRDFLDDVLVWSAMNISTSADALNATALGFDQDSLDQAMTGINNVTNEGTTYTDYWGENNVTLMDPTDYPPFVSEMNDTRTIAVDLIEAKFLINQGIDWIRGNLTLIELDLRALGPQSDIVRRDLGYSEGNTTAFLDGIGGLSLILGNLTEYMTQDLAEAAPCKWLTDALDATTGTFCDVIIPSIDVQAAAAFVAMLFLSPTETLSAIIAKQVAWMRYMSRVGTKNVAA